MLHQSHKSRPNFSTSESEDQITFDILCGVRSLVGSFRNRLDNESLRFDKESPIKLILDVPRGFALETLRILRSSTKDESDRKLIVVTFSFCPEYWEDLSEMQPDALIVDSDYEHDFTNAIRCISEGGQYRFTPKRESTLNLTERRVLSCLARGSSNRGIAKQLAIQEKTVTNTLNRVYHKLNLKSRTQALLYYWGMWYKLTEDSDTFDALL